MQTSTPAQTQSHQPGIEADMYPQPIFIRDSYKGADKLRGKVALITGGDSGIGRSVAVHFAREGADVAIVYLEENEDAYDTRKLVEAEGVQCLLIQGNVQHPEFCKAAVEKTVQHLGQLNILVNNAAEQHPHESFEDLTQAELENTFRTNIFAFFHFTWAALPHLKEGDSILNTTSVTAFRGSPSLIDYASTKGAITAFTRSLSEQLAEKGIRVNAVAPGPIWTPLIPATFPAEKVEAFGKDVPLKRAGQPCEVGPCYVFLASEDASYITGQTLHPNGGTVINA
ncbi:SDR family oxidoreductase [Siphonobacter curvatus]|uniref:NAD(P)-dependent oxidoreductase n=1 Tax=Siphonobacter curvatus TaxID=2094562 RepID=A0A2S7INY1_9BACT|nr:SDR family oxidoreductase [Siphonobacter curvatus]PQA59405.1 NAD(P)-dependent oxidoreductase [Siphonobacter curvatus]